MANSYTPNIKFPQPATGDRSWGDTTNSGTSLIDSLAPVGHLFVSTHEQPSSSLLVDISAGSFVTQDGVVHTYAGISGQAIPTVSTRVLYLDGTAAWALVVGAAYPTTPHVRLATVIAGAAIISSITDNRQCFPVAGSIADGVNLTLGSVTGTQIGTTATQKLGFFGHTPAVQPIMGAATAGATYTAAEQAMLNAVYAAVRALGLGS